MSSITNQPTQTQELTVNEVRKAIEHRATWMYFLLQEARGHGLEWDGFARAAINKTGQFHGAQMSKEIGNEASLSQFAQVFAPGAGRQVFEMEIVEQNEASFALDFHYCPLVAAWLKLGASDEELRQLCDIAMEGDRAITANFSTIDFTLGETIAQGKPCCQIRFTRK